jgi:hypothetical protein
MRGRPATATTLEHGQRVADECRIEREAASPADLFALLWDSLADVLGTAATAVLLRRALKRATGEGTSISGVVIERDELAYSYQIPAAWQTADHAAGLAVMRVIASTLRPLLAELTGSVVLRRLDSVPAFRKHGIFFLGEMS